MKKKVIKVFFYRQEFVEAITVKSSTTTTTQLRPTKLDDDIQPRPFPLPDEEREPHREPEGAAEENEEEEVTKVTDRSSSVTDESTVPFTTTTSDVKTEMAHEIGDEEETSTTLTMYRR